MACHVCECISNHAVAMHAQVLQTHHGFEVFQIDLNLFMFWISHETNRSIRSTPRFKTEWIFHITPWPHSMPVGINSTHSKPIGTSLQCCSAFDLMPFHFHASSENWLCQALVMSSQQLFNTWRITEHHFRFSIRTAQQQHPFTRFTWSAR